MTSRLSAYAVFLLGIFYSLTSLGVRVVPLLSALGIGGIVLALAMQRVVENFVASVILQTRRPFTVGDTVELDGRIGVVEDIDSRTTQIRGLDGIHIRIPNVNVVTSAIVNLTRAPSRRSTLTVGVAYPTNLIRATEALTQALERVPRVLTEPPPTVHLDGFGDSSIDFTILYWHASDVPSELAARHDLVIAVHQALARANIEIPFPQLVVWSGTEDPEHEPEDALDQIYTPYPDQVQHQAVSARRIQKWRILPRRGRLRKSAKSVSG